MDKIIFSYVLEMWVRFMIVHIPVHMTHNSSLSKVAKWFGMLICLFSWTVNISVARYMETLLMLEMQLIINWNLM
jgi:hypothetical protein